MAYVDYLVGEKEPKLPYDYKYKIRIASKDRYIQEKLKKGYLFDKYVTIAIYNYCHKGDTIIDVGANVGCVTVPCASWFKVLSFEPFLETFNYLTHNVEVNHVQKNVKLFNSAVGHKIMSTNLSSDLTKETQGELINYGAIKLGEHGQETKMITLDSLQTATISLIKVDVEGAEPLVFYGAKKLIKRDMPIIIFEKNYQNVSDEMIESMNLTKKIINFDIVKYCKSIGYTTLVYIRNENYMIIPNHRKLLLNDHNFKIIPVLKFPNTKFVTHNLKLFMLQKGSWGGGDFEPYRCKINDYVFEKPKETKKFAYCTLLMIDDSYLPGVLTLGYSIRKMGSTIDIVVLITYEISERAKKLLTKVYTKVINVDYIIPRKGLIKKSLIKDYPHYGKTFTKLNLLTLVEYDKVLFLDADSVVLHNFDSIFNLNPPAAVYFGGLKMHENNYNPRLRGDHYIWHQKYCDCCDHGKLMDGKLTDVVNNRNAGYGVSTECMLLKPDRKMYENIIKEIQDPNFMKQFPKSFQGFLSDAGYITWKFSGSWTGIDPRFLGRRGYPRVEELFGVTLGGAKPWNYENIKYAKYPDYKLWYQMFTEMNRKLHIKDSELLKLEKVIEQNIDTKNVYIRIVLPNESTGLINDAKIYEHYFTKYLTNSTIVIVTPKTIMKMGKHSDVNLFLESISDYSLVFSSNYNVMMVNHEFFDYPTVLMKLQRTKERLQNRPEYNLNRSINLYLCKTMSGMNFLKSLHITNVMYTKFTSSFPIINVNKDYTLMLHTAGSSHLKNTDVILKAWNEDLVKLVVTCYAHCLENVKKYVDLTKIAKNVEFHDTKMDSQELIKLKNTIGYHLCPSMVEGYGHYINEARLLSALILTIDAEPMNELINKNNGILIPYTKKLVRKNGSFMYLTDEKQLLKGVHRMLQLSDQEKLVLQKNAQISYQNDTLFFEAKMQELCNIISTQ